MAQATATVPEQARAGHCCQGGPGQGLPQVQRGLSLTCSQTLRRFKGQFSRQVNSRDEKRAGRGESPRQKMSQCSNPSRLCWVISLQSSEKVGRCAQGCGINRKCSQQSQGQLYALLSKCGLCSTIPHLCLGLGGSGR